MNTNTKSTTQPENTAAPSVTIAPRNPAKGVLVFVVTLTSHKEVRAYPCRTREKALELANRFIAGLSRRSPEAEAEADIIEGATPAPAQPSAA